MDRIRQPSKKTLHDIFWMRFEDIRPDGQKFYVLHILRTSTSVYGDSNEMPWTSGDSRLTSQSEEIRRTRALCSYSFSLIYDVGCYLPNQHCLAPTSGLIARPRHCRRRSASPVEGSREKVLKKKTGSSVSALIDLHRVRFPSCTQLTLSSVFSTACLPCHGSSNWKSTT